jgi:hypothetical protein
LGLAWYDGPAHPAAVEISWAAEEPLRLDRYESAHIGVESGHLLTRGPVSAWWKGPGAVPFRGALFALAHGFVPAAVPPTRGRAAEMSLAIGEERETGRRHWEAVPDAPESWPIVDGESWGRLGGVRLAGRPCPRRHPPVPDRVVVTVDVTP